jgi:subtilisin family serine protease
VTAGTAVALLVAGVVAGAADAQPSAPHATPTGAHAAPTVKHGLSIPGAAKMGALQHATGRQTVFVQLAGSGAAATSAHTYRAVPGAASTKRSKAKSAALSRRSQVKKDASAVLAAVRAKDGSARQLFQVSNAVPGIGVTADAAALRAIAARSDVVKISKIVPKTASNASAAQLTKVLNTWTNVHQLGAGVTVGIIDTGLDYTHADFGGPGTTAAYKAAETHASAGGLYDWRAALPPLAQAKVGGGWDFVGDNYDADPTSDTYQPVPHPDANPLDCNEHGTHVAGTVAGYGENADGSTFTGDYTALTGSDLDGMKIGPGMAPGAILYSLKVFGCEGSTDEVIPALDMALDPDGNGDFSDHLDIVNLSLGGDYATPDDPENAVVDQLAANGVLPVIAMGNNGDLTDTGGAPGNAVRSLAVASSVDAYQLLSGITVNAPGGVAGTAVGQVSVAYDWANAPDVTGDVVELSPANADGCAALSSADAAKVAGKIAWLTWDSDDATRKCGSVGRSANVKAAGAIGAIFTGDVPVFGAGITGDKDIPVFQLTKTETARLQSAAGAGTLNVTFTKTLLNNQPSTDPSITDLLSSFSSRGTHGSIGVVKPDVTAPGDTISSAGMGTGDEVLSISGTSMATPHTAGIAALVRAQHPSWTTEQVKAAIMNTASHDIYTGANQSGHIYGPARDGAGRVDALDAVNTEILAYDVDAGMEGAVSASFGVIEAPAGTTVTRTRTIKVENTGASSATLSLSYGAAIQQPGVSYSVSPSSVTIAAGASTNATVTVTVTADALRHTIDPTMASEQAGLARQYLSDASGRLLIDQAGHDTLRVPVYAAAKPVSSMTATGGFHAGKAALKLTGTGVRQGDPTTSEAYDSLVSVMDLGATSGRLPACGADGVSDCTVNETARGGDIKYVGAGSSRSPDDGTLENGWLYFGVATYGDNATIGNATIPYVDIDVDGDDVPDYEVYAQNAPGTDVLLAWLIDLNTGDAIDAEPVNFNLGDVDTNVFDTDVVTLPVWPAAIGVTGNPKKFPISYTVGTFSAYAAPLSNGDVDDVGPVAFDVAKPRVAVSDPLYLDQAGVSIDADVRNAHTKALVLHLHNATGNRAQVVDLGPAKASAPTHVRGTPGNRSVRLSWTAPSWTGAGPITGYDIRYSSNNGHTWRSASAAYHNRTATSATITGLTNGARYVFQVAALTSAGTSAYSASSAPVRPAFDRTHVGIGGSRHVHPGGHATLTVRVVDTTTHQPVHAKVTLWMRANRNHAWVKVATRITGTQGRASAQIRQFASAWYQWRYAGNSRHLPAHSVMRHVVAH